MTEKDRVTWVIVSALPENKEAHMFMAFDDDKTAIRWMFSLPPGSNVLRMYKPEEAS